MDPDEAGFKIRERLNKELPNAINVEVDISKCVRGEKNGVAECQIEEILEQLKPYVAEKTNENSPSIKMSDLYELGLINNKDLREKVCQELSLGNCNNKQLLKRLVINNISLDKIREIIEK